MTTTSPVFRIIGDTDVNLNRDVFLRNLIRELAGTLEEVVGLRDASGYLSVVGRKIGEQMNDDYKTALDTSRLSREQVSAVLVDLNRRIQGDFYVIEENDEKIVLGNRVCPFAEKVVGRTSMCMMTSNVFGVIVAENLGYARVVLNETIARGNSGCVVTVYLRQSEEPGPPAGREYFQ